MKKIDDFIKSCNLVFTDTMDRLEFARIGFDIEKEKVNYANCSNLLHLVTSFNKLYMLFRKEYDNLDKLKVGKSMKVINFNKFEYDGDYYRILNFYVDEPTITEHEDTFLTLRDMDGISMPFVSNYTSPFDEDYYNNDVNLNDTLCKQYLDLFEKYNPLLESYNKFKNAGIYADGTFSIYTTIDNYKADLLKGLKEFRMYISCNGINYAEVFFKLGDELTIDYDKSKLVFNSENVEDYKNDINKILTHTYLNKKYIENSEP